jgi:hypothetical protein
MPSGKQDNSRFRILLGQYNHSLRDAWARWNVHDSLSDLGMGIGSTKGQEKQRNPSFHDSLHGDSPGPQQ